MLEEFIANFLANRKRYIRCIIGFIFALLLVQYGFMKTLFIFIVAFIGYISGAPNFGKTIKKLLSSNNNEE